MMGCQLSFELVTNIYLFFLFPKPTSPMGYLIGNKVGKSPNKKSINYMTHVKFMLLVRKLHESWKIKSKFLSDIREACNLRNNE